MYAIAFDMSTADITEHYRDPHNKAYDDIRNELKEFGFENIQGSTYLHSNGSDGLAVVYKAISRLASIEWFKLSVKDIRVFKVEDWSDFTDIVKNAK